MAFAQRMGDWMHTNRPDIRFDFSFGYSMEHPDLVGAIRFLRRIGSPQADFLQCDGMRMRSDSECRALMASLAQEGTAHVNFTVYGEEAYHDHFAGRTGDFALIMRMLRAAYDAGIQTSAGIPLTTENCAVTDALVNRLRENGCKRVFLFVPHEEGRGILLDGVRLTEGALQGLSKETLTLLNRAIFRPEREWLTSGAYREETGRMLIVSLRKDNIDRYESINFFDLIAELEAADDAYYAVFPSFAELAERYGDPNGERMYRQRDLFAHYRRRFAQEFAVRVYDVTDERQSGSRRY